MTVIDDIISHLDTYWNEEVTDKPGFFNGHKVIVEKGKNWINIYNISQLFTDYDSAGLYRDETYTLRLDIGSTDTKTKRDNMVTEAQRIMNKVMMTGYHYNKVLSKVIRDSSDDYYTMMRVEIKALLQLKV